jgi:hypothetical protein
MVTREGRRLLVKIMDFGVARLKDSAMTVVGTVMGTVNYIAPEYIRSGEPDARSDLFAVGVMLYECISGKKPFDGVSASTVLFKIVNDPPDPLDLSMLHGLNPALRNMTERALSKDPADRFQTAEEFALALRAAKDPAWTGKLDETTVRMKVQPPLTPAFQPKVDPETDANAAKIIGKAVETNPTISSRPAESANKPTQPTSVPAYADRTVSVVLPKTGTPPEPTIEVKRQDVKSQIIPGAKTQIMALHEIPESKAAGKPTPVLPVVPGKPNRIKPPVTTSASSSKDITQEVVLPPKVVPKADPAKTEVLFLPKAMELPAAEKPTAPLPVVPGKPETIKSQVPAPPLPSKDITQEVKVPPEMAPKAHAAKTEVLLLPNGMEPPIQEKPAIPASAVPGKPGPFEPPVVVPVSSAKDSTQEVMVPTDLSPGALVAKTEVLVLPNALQLPDEMKPSLPEPLIPGIPEHATPPTTTVVVSIKDSAQAVGVPQEIAAETQAAQTESLVAPAPLAPLPLVVENAPTSPQTTPNLSDEVGTSVGDKSASSKVPIQEEAMVLKSLRDEHPTIPATGGLNNVEMAIPMPSALAAGVGQSSTPVAAIDAPPGGKATHASMLGDSHSTRTMVYVLLSVFAVGFLGGGGYFFWKSRRSQETQGIPQPLKQQAVAPGTSTGATSPVSSPNPVSPALVPVPEGQAALSQTLPAVLPQKKAPKHKPSPKALKASSPINVNPTSQPEPVQATTPVPLSTEPPAAPQEGETTKPPEKIHLGPKIKDHKN